MAYVRKTKDAAELSALRSMVAKMRKNNRGGRPKGSKNKNPSNLEPVRTLTVRISDYDVVAKCASAMQLPLVTFMHEVAESLKAKNPALFAPNASGVNL